MQSYILIICSVVIVIITVRTLNNIKRNRERKIREEQEADRQRRLAPLIKQKQAEDEELSIEKNIKCDDGITRSYKGFNCARG